MRNKNAQNNGKDGEYGEGKNEKEKRRENYPCNLVETALAACDVSTICNLADYLQVHSAVGMNHGISGGKTCDICTSDLEENLGWISKFYRCIQRPSVHTDINQHIGISFFHIAVELLQQSHLRFF